MKHLTIILIIVLTSCTKKTEHQNISSADSVDNVETTENLGNKFTTGDTIIIERFHPADNTLSTKDTIFQTLGIQITITEKTLDSYVTQGHVEEKTKYVNKYRDIERTIKIIRNKEILVDTILSKQTFKRILNKEFMNIAYFYGYWVSNVNADKIEFFGTIGVPDTDWTFAFYHYFDVKTKKFEIKELEDEEI